MSQALNSSESGKKVSCSPSGFTAQPQNVVLSPFEVICSISRCVNNLFGIFIFTPKGESMPQNKQRIVSMDDIWEKRRANLGALMGAKRMKAAQVCQAAKVSPNTLGKFMRGESKTLSQKSLEAILAVLESNLMAIDSNNPLSNAKTELFKIIEGMSEEEARQELERISSSTADRSAS
ncbi:helix-turn-helix domain-containing protein [Leisingera caerulea]|uniref:helix-turn-helix domain-containing protein n=1 Tax=Leisingera caerulea TaxID=506591 RepID=UPI003F4AADEE